MICHGHSNALLAEAWHTSRPVDQKKGLPVSSSIKAKDLFFVGNFSASAELKQQVKVIQSWSPPCHAAPTICSEVMRGRITSACWRPLKAHLKKNIKWWCCCWGHLHTQWRSGKKGKRNGEKRTKSGELEKRGEMGIECYKLLFSDSLLQSQFSFNSCAEVLRHLVCTRPGRAQVCIERVMTQWWDLSWMIHVSMVDISWEVSGGCRAEKQPVM